MLAWKIAPALACGNTVVLKPAETTPLTALAFAEICADAGLPPGVVNIVTGDGLTGQLVAGHPGIDKVAFTGSPEVGREIAKSAALWGKRLTLELGGTSANIVCADADIEAAAQGIVEGVFVRQGHACCASSRVFVAGGPCSTTWWPPSGAGCPRCGPATRSTRRTDIGAVNSRGQLDKITELARSGGGGGRGALVGAARRRRIAGFWFPPTMFTTVSRGAPHRQGGALLAGAHRVVVRHARGGGRADQQLALRAVGRGVDAAGRAERVAGRAAAGRGGLGQLVRPA